MAWSVRFSKAADRDFAKLDKPTQIKVFRYRYERIDFAANSKDLGKPPQHELAGLWRYRVGDYRIVCRIEDAHLVVLVIEIGHRNMIYD